MNYIDLDEFERIYRVSGEVAARLVLGDVDPTLIYYVFANHPELAHWLKSFPISDNDWIQLIEGNTTLRAHYLQYCDLSKCNFTVVSRVVLWLQDCHHAVDLTRVSQEMWGRLIIACARDDIEYFYKYVDRDQLSATALWKFEQYELAREAP